MEKEFYLRAIRGAISVEENSKESISKATIELLSKIIEVNKLCKENIESAIFTLTHDLNADFPARSARVYLDWNDISMICSQEVPVPGSLPMCLRVLIHAYTSLPKSEIKSIYLKEAAKLRLDISK